MSQAHHAGTGGRRATHTILADQVMVSGVNFATGILLARFLGPEGYGQYVLANGIILFIAGVQMALVISPMMATGPTLSGDESRRYYGATLWQQLAFAGLACAMLLAAMPLAKHFLPADATSIIWPLTAALVAFLCQDFVRRFFFTLDRPGVAFITDLLGYGARLGLIIAAGLLAALNAALALWMLAATSAFAFLAGAVALWRQSHFQAYSQGEFLTTAQKHWQFGKWLLAANIAYWVGSQLVIYLSAGLLSVTAAGAMAATLNIVAVANILFLALENFVPARAARAHAHGGAQGLNRYLRRVAFLGGTATLAIVAISSITPDLWLELLYGKSYEGYGWMVYWWGGYYLLSFFQRPLSAGLRTLGNTRALFLSNVGGAATILLIGYPAILATGLEGAMLSLCASQLIMVGTMAFYYHRAYVQSTRETDANPHNV